MRYYRLPWSFTDNAISWLEVTTSCNLACKGCYRPKHGGHKSLEKIREDLDVFEKHRKSDCISVAGGDPLVHPEIVEITRMIRERGWKPVINTNGLALSRELLRKLKSAGVFGFTFHIDTSQKRKDSPVAAAEGDHNALRQRMAEMLAQAGGISCAFNQTVSSTTLSQVPEVVAWARRNPEIVHTVVFILYREPRLYGDFDFYAHGRKVPLAATYEKTSDWAGNRALKASDVIKQIRKVEPGYEPSAYLNGTEDPESTKWLIATRVGNERETFGYVTPRFMEAVQQGHRLLRGRWLSYSSPRFLSAGGKAALAFSLIDRGMRKAAKRFLQSALRAPSTLARGTHLQTFTIIQPVDILPDGRMNMCDGCPDITVHEGRLLWSCRLEEVKKYGCFVNAAPRDAA
ncbi:MAG: radical SAM protein [Oligoflexia bacterium]|nr:radical SAM protein [Oligoflexia bacterium]